MTDPSSSPEQTWRDVITTLATRSKDPDFPFEPLSASNRSYLRITKPIAIVQGHALLATPHKLAKRALEGDLGEAVAAVWEELSGTPIHLAISVDPTLVDDSLPPVSYTHLPSPRDS